MALQIPALNLHEQYKKIGPEIEAAVLDVLRSGHYILAEQVARLESSIATICGVKHGIGVANGSDALQLALWCLGVGPGDEVITTPFTFAATVSAIILQGAKPVFVDVSENNYNINVDLIEAAITPRTKAILPVHLYGLASDMDAIKAIAQKHSLKIIEDSAQALGAQYRGRPVGSLGDLACISFYPTKNLGACGDAGMVVTNNDKYAERLRILRAHGMKKRYYHDELGINSRLDELQAAVLNAKLPYLQEWNRGRQSVAQNYHEALADIRGVQVPQPETAQGDSSDTDHVWHQYTVRVMLDQIQPGQYQPAKADSRANLRDLIMTRLAERGIGTMCYYPVPLHLQSAYANLGYKPGDFPTAERLAQEVISLPIYPELDQASIQLVATSLKEVIAELSAVALTPTNQPVFAK
jgi:dTDP-4-amino-4,6-dideoxygalactose transaminase